MLFTLLQLTECITLLVLGANAGTNIVDVVAGLKRNVDSAPDYLLIGATDVNGMVGGPLAGIALSDLSLGMGD